MSAVDLPGDVLAVTHSTPIDGVSYPVRIDTDLKVFVRNPLWTECGRLDITPPEEALQLIDDHFAGVLYRQRRIERRWRGEITPERIATDEAEAYELDALQCAVDICLPDVRQPDCGHEVASC